MPGLPDMSYVSTAVKDFLKDFALNYMKGFAVAIIKDMAGDNKNLTETKVTPRLLLRDVPVPPECEGEVAVSVGGAETRPEYWKVRSDWQVEVWKTEADCKAGADLDEEAKKKAKGFVEVFCPWGYWPYSWAPSAKEFPKRRGGPMWVSDTAREACAKCESKFNFSNRKHHCRTCGEVFCADCSGNKWPLFNLGYSGPEKVCDPCYERLNTKGLADFTFPEPTETFGLRLSHDQRKPKFMMLADQKSCDKWSSAIRVCARYASPPANPNKILAAAFESAHRYVWNSQGPWWNWWKVFGNEVEMLTVLLNFIVKERCLDNVLASMGAPYFLRTKAKELAMDTIATTVENLVSAGWPPIADAAAKAEGKIRETVGTVLVPIGEAKHKILTSLRDSLSEAINGAISSVAKPLLSKVLPMVFGPMLNCHIQCYRVLREIYDAAKSENDNQHYTMQNERDYHYRMRRASWQIYYKTYTIASQELDPMMDALRLLGCLPPFNYLWPYGLYYAILESCRNLLNDAMFTAEKDDRVRAVVGSGNSAVSAGLTEIFPDIAHRYFEDSKTASKELMVEILWLLIGTPILKTVQSAPGVSQIISTADGMIPDALKDLMSISEMFSELIRSILSDVIQEQVESNTETCMEKLQNGYDAYTSASYSTGR